MLAIVDTSALYAAADRQDLDYHRCRDVLTRAEFRLVVPALVVAEATYLIGQRGGATAEAEFVIGLQDVEVDAPHRDEWMRIADLIRQYRDFPLGTTDASIVALAERLRTDLIITLDRRHFSAIRPRHVSAFRLLPE